MSLKEKIVRLASEKPELRSVLVPLLREAKGKVPPEFKEHQFTEEGQGPTKGDDPETPPPWEKDKKDNKKASSLHESLVRLAYEQPEHREHLLPLIRAASLNKAARDKWDEVLVGDKVRIRIKGHPNHFVLIEELPQKGKRRLKRIVFDIGNSLMSLRQSGPEGRAYNYFMVENLKRDWNPSTSQSAEANAKGLQKAIEKALKDLDKEGVEYPSWLKDSLTGRGMPSVEEVHYLQVEPVDYAPVEIKAKDEFYLKAEWDKFSVTLNNGYSDKELQEYAYSGDPHYTKLVSTSPAGARKFFKWVKANEADIKKMSGKQLQQAMDKGKIRYKYQSSVWR